MKEEETYEYTYFFALTVAKLFISRGYPALDDINISRTRATEILDERVYKFDTSTSALLKDALLADKTRK